MRTFFSKQKKWVTGIFWLALLPWKLDDLLIDPSVLMSVLALLEEAEKVKELRPENELATWDIATQ